MSRRKPAFDEQPRDAVRIRERWALDGRGLPELSGRARRLATWLSDAANPALSPRARERALQQLEGDLSAPRAFLIQLSRDVRAQVYPWGNHRDWLLAAGWLDTNRVSEVLPERVSPAPGSPNAVVPSAEVGTRMRELVGRLVSPGG